MAKNGRKKHFVTTSNAFLSKKGQISDFPEEIFSPSRKKRRIWGKRSPATYKTPMQICRLYLHEAARVYGDRMVSESDVERFTEILYKNAKANFEGLEYDELVAEPNIFGTFVEEAEGDEEAPVEFLLSFETGAEAPKSVPASDEDASGVPNATPSPSPKPISTSSPAPRSTLRRICCCDRLNNGSPGGLRSIASCSTCSGRPRVGVAYTRNEVTAGPNGHTKEHHVFELRNAVLSALSVKRAAPALPSTPHRRPRTP